MSGRLMYQSLTTKAHGGKQKSPPHNDHFDAIDCESVIVPMMNVRIVRMSMLNGFV
jgi:hypothetical protein